MIFGASELPNGGGPSDYALMETLRLNDNIETMVENQKKLLRAMEASNTALMKAITVMTKAVSAMTGFWVDTVANCPDQVVANTEAREAVHTGRPGWAPESDEGEGGQELLAEDEDVGGFDSGSDVFSVSVLNPEYKYL